MNVSRPKAAATDREIARDVVITLRAVLDLAVAEFREPVLERRQRMRAVGRSQLDVAARLIEYLAGQWRVAPGGGEKMGPGAAAGSSSSLPDPAPFSLLEEGEVVKNAGEPGELGQLPGMPNFDPRSGTAEGSNTYGRPDGANVGTVYADNANPYKSSQVPAQSLSVESTGTEATQMMHDLISGVDQTGPGQTATGGDQSEHVFGPPHHDAAKPGPGL